MEMYRPNKPFTTPFMILNPTSKKSNGRIVKEYPTQGEIIYVSFTTFGGTETVINGLISVRDTGNIETWYRPDIKSDSRLKRMSDGKIYDVLGDPENIEMRNQFMKFKIEYSRGSNG